jgi:MFS family permease
MGVQNGSVMAFSALYLPLVAELGAGRGAVAAVQSGVVLLGGLAAPLAGLALDRWGPRRLFQGGALLAAAGLALASQAASLPGLVLAYGVVAGAGLACLSSPPNMVVVAQWFPGRRGRAIALADLGTPLGTFALVPLTQLLVERAGWRPALLVLAGLLVAVVLPANALQRLPEDGVAPGPGARRPAALAAAARTATFWRLAALRFATGVGFALINLHALAAAVGAGIPPVRAAAAIGSVAVVSLGGRVAVGWLVDRMGPGRAILAGFGCAVGGIACLGRLVATGEPGWLLGFVLLFGLAQGSGGIVATATATAAFRGPAVGAVTGWIAIASGPGEALGVWAGGALHDRTGGYPAALALAALALVAGIAAVWRVTAGPPRRP